MKRTKNELLQSCIEQFEHIDSVNNNPTLNTTESLIREIKKAINYTHCCTELCDEERCSYTLNNDSKMCDDCGKIFD
jgi:hypothetical protein